MKTRGKGILAPCLFLIVRVIGGSLKGRTLFAPKGETLRPTADPVKECLFNILGAEIVGAKVLDLFAGTGSIGIEALSRGAQQVVFVEKHPAHLQALTRNLAACRLDAQVEVYGSDANKILRLLQKRAWRFEVIFLDPPYRQTNMLHDVLNAILELELLADAGVVVVEHAQTFLPPAAVQGKLFRARSRRVGDTVLSFYGAAPPADTAATPAELS